MQPTVAQAPPASTSTPLDGHVPSPAVHPNKVDITAALHAAAALLVDIASGSPHSEYSTLLFSGFE
jgi:hypothetical protein